MSEDKHWQNRVELSLDNRQIFLLFFASAAVLALVFALGVVVGKRSDAAPAKAAPTDPLALLDQMGADSGEETLTFHEALTKPEQNPAPAGAPAPAAPPATENLASPSKPAVASPTLASPKPAPQEKPEPAPAPRAKTLIKALAAAIPGAQAPSAAENDSSSGKKPTGKPGKEPLAAKEKGKKAEVKDAEGDGTYTLQLSAFQEKREAESFMQKLRGSGMQPFMTSTTIPGRGVWFRVRLGKYRTWDEALAAKQDFEKKAKLIAYVSKN
jgi:septal ring-binding cell division protein DamX